MLIFRPEITELTICSPTVSGTAAVLLRFVSTKIEDVKMDRQDQELLDKQMRRLSAPRNDGAIAVLLAVMFLVGITLGGVLSEHETDPAQIASIE
jgi:hypothetical protein